MNQRKIRHLIRETIEDIGTSDSLTSIDSITGMENDPDWNPCIESNDGLIKDELDKLQMSDLVDIAFVHLKNYKGGKEQLHHDIFQIGAFAPVGVYGASDSFINMNIKKVMKEIKRLLNEELITDDRFNKMVETFNALIEFGILGIKEYKENIGIPSNVKSSIKKIHDTCEKKRIAKLKESSRNSFV